MFENSVNSAGNETEKAVAQFYICLRTLLILQVMKLVRHRYGKNDCLRTLLILQVMKQQVVQDSNNTV